MLRNLLHHSQPWFSMDEKEPVAYAKVEVVEASDMKPSDLNGLADPYVKGHLGGYRFKTKIQRKTLTPKWHEEFKIPIITWESPNVLAIEVRDKDHFYDDTDTPLTQVYRRRKFGSSGPKKVSGLPREIGMEGMGVMREKMTKEEFVRQLDSCQEGSGSGMIEELQQNGE